MMRKRHVMVALGLVCVVVMLTAQLECHASENVALGRAWPSNQQVSIDQIDHHPYSMLLAKYTDATGMVNYSAWKASKEDMRTLDHYLQTLSQANTSKPASREAKLAFWINAYNAVTIRGILREYPTSSIRDHTPLVMGYNIWDDLKLIVGENRYSLNQMEHNILRKMGEPRIHFAIVCASIGCPRLLAEAYTADRLEQQLLENTQYFFSDQSKFHADIKQKKIHISPILKWFGGDFGSNLAQRMKTISPYLPDPESRELAASGTASVSYLDYDWNLNDQAAHAATK